jgi:hypothetical protein
MAVSPVPGINNLKSSQIVDQVNSIKGSTLDDLGSAESDFSKAYTDTGNEANDESDAYSLILKASQEDTRDVLASDKNDVSKAVGDLKNQVNIFNNAAPHAENEEVGEADTNFANNLKTIIGDLGNSTSSS